MKNNQDIIFNDYRITNLVSFTVKTDLISDDEFANKNFVDDSIGDDDFLRFNENLKNNLKVPVGNDVYSFTKCDKRSIRGTTIIVYPNTCGNLVQNWRVKCNDKKIRKFTNFLCDLKKQSVLLDTVAQQAYPQSVVVLSI